MIFLFLNLRVCGPLNDAELDLTPPDNQSNHSGLHANMLNIYFSVSVLSAEGGVHMNTHLNHVYTLIIHLYLSKILPWTRLKETNFYIQPVICIIYDLLSFHICLIIQSFYQQEIQCDSLSLSLWCTIPVKSLEESSWRNLKIKLQKWNEIVVSIVCAFSIHSFLQIQIYFDVLLQRNEQME